MKSKLTKIILLITLAILPTEFSQAQTIKKTKKKAVKTKRTTKNIEPLIPDKITVAPNTVKARPDDISKIGAGDKEPVSDTFRTDFINKNGINSLSLPENMTAEPVKEQSHKKGEIEWTIYHYEWKTPKTKNASAPSLKVGISTEIFNADFPKVTTVILGEELTPEALILEDQTSNLSFADAGGYRIKESKVMKLDGTDGSYALSEFPGGKFVAIWKGYRLLDGKAQILILTLEGDPNEIAKVEKIIKSFKLSAK